MKQTLERKHFTIELDHPELFVDNQSRNRSGHMTHGMAEFAPGCVIDFNSNCSAILHDGHFPHGWVEYRISRDAGKTWSDFYTLPYSWQSFLDGIYYISVEKAVACTDGAIVAFCLRNDATDLYCCEPWATPTVVISHDQGQTWSEPVEYSPYPGRTYDALTRDGIIYVLHNCNEHFLGSKPEHVYRLYTSQNNGQSFEEVSVIPFDTLGRGYGSMVFDDSGVLHAYAYNVNAEDRMDHAVSSDLGKTWTVLEPSYVAKGIRNPQTALIDGVFILHGRAGDAKGFILYTSEDGANWDEGTILVPNEKIAAYYSNNLNLQDENGNFLLMQYSDNYQGHRVNVMHQVLRVLR